MRLRGIMRTSRLLTTATLGLALAAPTAAQAAESFVGVTDGTKVVQFTTDTLPATSAPKALTGLAAGESLVALDRTPAGELLGLADRIGVRSHDGLVPRRCRVRDLESDPLYRERIAD